jgi:hypothetical protein
MTLVKVHPKKFAQTTDFFGLGQLVNSFLAETFLGTLFAKVICAFSV